MPKGTATGSTNRWGGGQLVDDGVERATDGLGRHNLVRGLLDCSVEKFAGSRLDFWSCLFPSSNSDPQRGASAVFWRITLLAFSIEIHSLWEVTMASINQDT